MPSTKTTDPAPLDESPSVQRPRADPTAPGPGLRKVVRVLRKTLAVVRDRVATVFAAEVRVGPRRLDGVSQPRVFKPFLVLLTVAVFALPTLFTLNLKHAGEEGVKAQNHLQALTTETRIQDGLEWRLIAGAITAKVAGEELAVTHMRGHAILKEAAINGLPPAAEARITKAIHGYFLKVDQEVKLLAAGEKEEAAEWDEAQVDPAFETMSALLAKESKVLETKAENAQRYGDIGVLLTVLMSLTLVSLVQSRRRQAEVRNQAKRQGETRYRALIDQSSDLVAVVDRTGHATYLSPSVERLLAFHDQEPLTAGEAPADAEPIDLISAVDPVDRAQFSMALESAVPGRMSAGEFRLNGEGGTSTYEMTVQDLTADPSVGGLVVTGHDVTDRLAMQREMEHRALHDTLTGLPNRALLFDRFEQAMLGAERDGACAGLLLLDLDRFKEVNDTFGHHYGDELLRQIGPRLAAVVRDVDTIARLGGDEFAVLLPDVGGVNDASTVAAALLSALAVPFRVEGVDMDVEASIGVVVSGEHGQDAITLMQRADIAMYVAKTQHLGLFVYDPEVDSHSASKLALVWDLRRALDHGELVLYYQPKVSVTTGDLVGAEALVRWQHPEHGLIFPDAFIPLAERTGLINPLTRHILDTALAQARIWIDEGRPLPIAVNLSARNLHNERFAAQVDELLAVHDVPAHLLELEVTESAIMIDPLRAGHMLEKLSALGIRLSLDDFGAGYTSLSQLKALPISEIKIDRSFVRTMNEDSRDAVIVHSIIALGHNLGLTLVAEGVETESALTTLAGFGCDVVQGYYLTRPIPVAAFNTWSAGRQITPMPAHRDPAFDTPAVNDALAIQAAILSRPARMT